MLLLALVVVVVFWSFVVRQAWIPRSFSLELGIYIVVNNNNKIKCLSLPQPWQVDRMINYCNIFFIRSYAKDSLCVHIFNVTLMTEGILFLDKSCSIT